ncbi:LytR/AlgR family response regulator transcription factor [Flavobacterium luteum]|uniref:LytR/AlgR family response regulator transcription factor n=1 Tax=Flavobacterium luteum TaxID=2026654 RepID=UPI0029391993|nr:LytTR family DNA-binding domain-containing protein [Flavobacterium luteum]
MIKCIVIDDEQMAREILAAMLADVKDVELVATFPDAIEAMKFLNKNQVDLIFLDIHMPSFTGFDFVQTIKNLPQVVFVTMDENFAKDAFEYDCIVDYLVKPIQLDRFSRSIDRVFRKLNSNFKNDIQITDRVFKEKKGVSEIYVNINSRLIKIDLDTICSIQSQGDYINIKTTETNYVVHTQLKKIKEKLPVAQFLQIHRSHIINIDKIIDIQDNTVLIAKEIIPISKQNKTILMKYLNLL